jgi:antitoxin component of RelBE/YafQ-DinJ toxin-antitoxin module
MITEWIKYRRENRIKFKPLNIEIEEDIISYFEDVSTELQVSVSEIISIILINHVTGTSVDLDETIKEELDILSETNNLSIEELVNTILLEYLIKERMNTDKNIKINN